MLMNPLHNISFQYLVELARKNPSALLTAPTSSVSTGRFVLNSLYWYFSIRSTVVIAVRSTMWLLLEVPWWLLLEVPWWLLLEVSWWFLSEVPWWLLLEVPWWLLLEVPWWFLLEVPWWLLLEVPWWLLLEVPWWLLALVAQLDVHPTGDQKVAGSTPAGSATFFHGDWSWNVFCGHSLPSTDSRAVLFCYLFCLFSPFLWETTQNDPQGLTCR